MSDVVLGVLSALSTFLGSWDFTSVSQMRQLRGEQ